MKASMLSHRVSQLLQDLKLGFTWAVEMALEVIFQFSPTFVCGQ
jgi:hypothetical protein